MQIRRYKPGEEAALWQLYHDTTHIIVRQYYTQEQVERWAPHDKDMDQWAARIKEKNPFVAVENDTIVGFAELEADGSIDYFYVHHQWQGKGVGSMLYNAVEQEAINQNIPSLFAEVSLAAKTFFLKQGFKITAEQHNIVCGTPAPNFRMENSLRTFSGERGRDCDTYSGPGT